MQSNDLTKLLACAKASVAGRPTAQEVRLNVLHQSDRGLALLCLKTPDTPHDVPTTDTSPLPPTSVREARLRPDYRDINGWHGAIAKEVKRVEKFGAIRLVRFRAFRDASRLNPLTTSIGYLVPVLTCKADPNGGPRELDVLNPGSLPGKHAAASGAVALLGCGGN